MDSRRPNMTLRPPLTGGGGVSTASRPKTLKRTISKCGLDSSASANDLSGLAFKKLAPLHDPTLASTTGLSISQQQLQQVQYEATIMRQHLERFQLQQQLEQRANEFYEDDGEPVLLPRDMPQYATPYDTMDDDRHPMASEYSPVAPLGWDGSPQGAKNRYYASVLETSGAMVSPSPHHVLYPYTPPQSGESSTNSTISFASTAGPHTPHGLPRNNSLGSVQPQAMQDREYLSAANLHAVMVNYLEEMFQYYDLARSFTFRRVGEMLHSVPFALRYIQGLVKNRLGISWQLVESFVRYLVAFIADEDIQEATIKEFADFLRSIQNKLYVNMPPGNIFLNLFEFFHNVLTKFKKYLIQHWIELRRIQFPCEFGKKSLTLFLCMECHREHW